MIPVVTPEEMRDIDAAAPEPVEVLIDRAGAAVAREARRMLGGAYGRTVAVIAGPGNNGADGRVAADRLAAAGVSVQLYDAMTCPDRLDPADLVIDAAFGTGFRDRWTGPDVGTARVLAVDVPTGVDGLTGAASPGVLRADRTVTFAALKPGLLLGDGPALAGEIVLADVGLDVSRASIHLVERADVVRWFRPRPAAVHKWSRALRVVAGSAGMTGAAWLASGAAMRADVGIVHLSSPGITGEAPTEVVRRPVPAFDWADDVLDDHERFHALVIGPGLGREEHTIPSITRVVAEAVVPVVVDGDGLFALTWNETGEPVPLLGRESPTLLTPHDGEYAQLTGTSPGADRVAAVRRLAATTGAAVLLKGPTTLVSAPDGEVFVVDRGDERLATAGTGDVLAGVAGAFAASGMPVALAGAAAAWVHGEAGRRCRRAGTVAGDLLPAVADVVAELASDAGGSAAPAGPVRVEGG